MHRSFGKHASSSSSKKSAAKGPPSSSAQPSTTTADEEEGGAAAGGAAEEEEPFRSKAPSKSDDSLLVGSDQQHADSRSKISLSLRRATSWIMGRRESVPRVLSKRISNSRASASLAGGGNDPANDLAGYQVEASGTPGKTSVRGGGASLRGYRHAENEDALCLEADLVAGAAGKELESIGLAAVIDGHRGVRCMSYLKTNMGPILKRLLNEDNACDWSSDFDEWSIRCGRVLTRAFDVFDREFIDMARARDDPSGACVVVALVKGSQVVFAHAGDSLAIVINTRGAPGNRATRVTRPHDASNSDEVRSIISRGGNIINDRLQGKLEPLRTIGDLAFKRYGLSSVPEINACNLKPSDVVLLCSDGITDKMKDEEIADFVVDRLQVMDGDPSRVASALVLYASADKRAVDDCTALLLVFDPATSEAAAGGGGSSSAV